MGQVSSYGYTTDVLITSTFAFILGVIIARNSASSPKLVERLPDAQSAPAAVSDSEVEHLRSMVAAERQGRVTAEKRLRQLQQSQSAVRHGGDANAASGSPGSPAVVTAPALSAAERGAANVRFPRTGGGLFVPIGRVEAPFSARNGTPRQGGLVPSVRSRVVLDKRIAPRESTEGLAAYSHVWLIWEFHENTNAASAAIKTKVAPPRAGGARVGIYATRTPHRHNPSTFMEHTIAKITLTMNIVNNSYYYFTNQLYFAPFCVIKSDSFPLPSSRLFCCDSHSRFVSGGAALSLARRLRADRGRRRPARRHPDLRREALPRQLRVPPALPRPCLGHRGLRRCAATRRDHNRALER